MEPYLIAREAPMARINIRTVGDDLDDDPNRIAPLTIMPRAERRESRMTQEAAGEFGVSFAGIGERIRNWQAAGAVKAYEQSYSDLTQAMKSGVGVPQAGDSLNKSAERLFNCAKLDTTSDSFRHAAESNLAKGTKLMDSTGLSKDRLDKMLEQIRELIRNLRNSFAPAP